MGADYSAVFVFGAQIPMSCLRRLETKSGCHHTIKEEHKFCPECGKPSRVAKSIWVPGYNGCDQYKDLSIFRNINDSENEFVILGVQMGSADEYNTTVHITKPDLQTKIKMQNLIEDYCRELNAGDVNIGYYLMLCVSI